MGWNANTGSGKTRERRKNRSGDTA